MYISTPPALPPAPAEFLTRMCFDLSHWKQSFDRNWTFRLTDYLLRNRVPWFQTFLSSFLFGILKAHKHSNYKTHIQTHVVSLTQMRPLRSRRSFSQNDLFIQTKKHNESPTKMMLSGRSIPVDHNVKLEILWAMLTKWYPPLPHVLFGKVLVLLWETPKSCV